MPSDNNNYDDLLDESFDLEEEDYEEIDFGDDDGFDDKFSSLDDEYDDEEDGVFGDDESVGSGQSKPKKKGLSLDFNTCLLYTSPSPRDRQKSRMPSSA